MAYLGVNNQVGVREELADYIANVDAKSTPYVSMAPKGKDLGNVIMSWQVDDYSAPQLGGVIDGTDVTSYTNESANRLRVTNYAQAFRRNSRVGFIAETQNVAGAASEVAYNVAKLLVEIKRDMESTFLCTNQAAQQDNGSSTAYQTGSLGNWLLGTNSSNIGALASGSAFAPAGGVTPGTAATNAISSVTSANFNEATVQNVLTAIYSKTGVFRDYDCILGTTLKRAFTNLTAGGQAVLNGAGTTNTYTQTAVRTFSQDLSNSTFTSSLDLFEGDFGRLVLHPTTFLGGKNGAALDSQAYRGYVIHMYMVEIRYCKLPEVKDLPDAGGGPIRLVQAIAG
ncbi:MAG: SU10 major capsid protein, partial [Candidatus Kapaibacteriota bacterium]